MIQFDVCIFFWNGLVETKKLDECELGFLKQHPQGFLAKALVDILWFFFGHGGGSSRASFATAAPTPCDEAPFFFRCMR